MKKTFEDQLAAWGKWAAENTRKTVLIVLAVTILAVVGISRLQMDMSFYSIMPKASRKVEDLRKITEEFPSASTIIVVMEGEDPLKLREAVDAAAEELAKERYSDSVEGIHSTLGLEKIQAGRIFLGTDIAGDGAAELSSGSAGIISMLNRNLGESLADHDMSSLERRIMEGTLSSFHNLLDILLETDSGSVDRDDDLDRAFNDVVQNLLVPEEYFINEEEDMALVFIRPAFTVNDIFILAERVRLIEEALISVEDQFGVSIGLTGLPVVAKDEAVTSEEGLAVSSLLAFGLIIGLMIFSFRMKSIPLLTGLPLLLGIVWTVGITGYTLGRLNIMTAMYVIALMGLGIDAAIHFVTAFLQERETGKEFKESLADGIGKSGRGIVIGAITTAAAFFALILGESDLVRELAIVAGCGMLCELLAMFVLLPALLSMRNNVIKKRNLRDSILRQRTPISLTGALGRAVKKTPFVFTMLSVISVLILGVYALRVEVESNIMNMEAAGLESVLLQDRMVEKFNMAPDSLYIYSESIGETRALVEQLEHVDLVGEVDAVTRLLPDIADQEALANSVSALIADFRNTPADGSVSGVNSAEELQRVQLEIGLFLDNLRIAARRSGYTDQAAFIDQLNSLIHNSGYMMEVFHELTGTVVRFLETELEGGFITPENLPPDLAADYFSSTESEANLITVIPRENLWEESNRLALYAQLDDITDSATGMVMAADQMSRIARKDGVRAALAALAVICVILIIDFRNVKLAVLTMLPLGASMIALLGFMGLLGIKFDFINIIAIPLLIGIGIDDAVHISHRYRLEGKGKMDKVILKVGRAVGMTTLTTVIGFASFIPSIMRAMRSTGIVLSLAMFLALMFSIFLHGSLLVIVRERLGLNIDAWKLHRRTY